MIWDFGIIQSERREARFFDIQGTEVSRTEFKKKTIEDYLDSLGESVNFLDRELPGFDGVFLVLLSKWIYESNEQRKRDLASAIERVLEETKVSSDSAFTAVEWMLGLVPVSNPFIAVQLMAQSLRSPVLRGSSHPPLAELTLNELLDTDKQMIESEITHIERQKQTCAEELARYLKFPADKDASKSSYAEYLVDAYEKFRVGWLYYANVLVLKDWNEKNRFGLERKDLSGMDWRTFLKTIDLSSMSHTESSEVIRKFLDMSLSNR